jgi:hypothetical protein
MNWGGRDREGKAHERLDSCSVRLGTVKEVVD